jgi:flagellar motor switch protein FliN/FliY
VTDTASITTAVENAATTALAHIPIADSLVVGVASDAALPQPFLGVAVTARFSGTHNGEVLVAVEQAVADALRNSPLGALDVTAALGPALSAAAGTVGTVITGPGQALPPGPALDALLAKPHAAIVALQHGGVTRAVVGLSMNLDAPSDEPVSAASYPTTGELAQSNPVRAFVPAPIPRNGLDMLRDVAMDVTAQIGSTRMTVSELLTLSDGAVIELDRAAGAPADLLVNGHLIARGEIVVIDENFGLRITEIIADGDSVSPPA